MPWCTRPTLSAPALEVARDNARRLGLEERVTFHLGQLLEPVSARGRVDLVVSNPPYVDPGERASLEPEVREHEPGLALFPPGDALSIYRRLVPDAFECAAAWRLPGRRDRAGAPGRRRAPLRRRGLRRRAVGRRPGRPGTAGARAQAASPSVRLAPMAQPRRSQAEKGRATLRGDAARLVRPPSPRPALAPDQPTPTASGSPRSCCSRPPSRPCCPTTPPSSSASPRCRRSPRSPRKRCSRPGPGSATTTAPATCTAGRSTWPSATAATSRARSRPRWPCPGVGLYTASAVLSIAYGLPLPVVDGNVRRVLARAAGAARASVPQGRPLLQPRRGAHRRRASRRLEPGADGAGRDRVPAEEAGLPRVPAAPALRGSRARDRRGAARGPRRGGRPWT